MKSTVFVVGGMKGGSGKTTIATNLAILLSNIGKNILLVDADDQGTATDFTNARNDTKNSQIGYTAIQLYDKAVRTQVERLKSNYDYIVIDTGGRDTSSQRAAMSIADFYLVPFVPRSFDIWTLDKVSSLIDEVQNYNLNMNSICFLNRADAHGNENSDSKKVLLNNNLFVFLDAPIGNRKSFSHSSANGLGIKEYHPIDIKAVNEIDNFFKKLIHLN